MILTATGTGWIRRARPLLGTLVEVGVRADSEGSADATTAAFDAVALVQARMSRFDLASDVCRFHGLRRGQSISVDQHTAAVLQIAAQLREMTGSGFDITLRSAPGGWRCGDLRLHMLDDEIRLDLGGIAKGYAVDLAVQALVNHGCASGWVNAGGDLRIFGGAELPVWLRDEVNGGAREFARLTEGAFATSYLGISSDCRAVLPCGETRPVHAHVSVAAPLCVWADALTKVVAISGNSAEPLLVPWGA